MNQLPASDAARPTSDCGAHHTLKLAVDGELVRERKIAQSSEAGIAVNLIESQAICQGSGVMSGQMKTALSAVEQRANPTTPGSISWYHDHWEPVDEQLPNK